MQQSIITLILASLVGLFLSGYWMVHEVRFVLVMSEFDQDISWLVQAPLMLFITLLILGLFMLFIGSIGEFNFAKLRLEIPWKRLILTILAFDLVIFILFLANEHLKFKESWIYTTFVAILLIVVYVVGVRKHGVTPLFFLISSFVVSMSILSILVELL
jgi:hypothetical protein